MNSSKINLKVAIENIENAHPLSVILANLIRIDPLELSLAEIDLHGRLMTTAMAGVDHDYTTAITNLQHVVERGNKEMPEEIWAFIQAGHTGLTWGMCRDTIHFIQRSIYSNTPPINGAAKEVQVLGMLKSLLEALMFDAAPSVMQSRIADLIDLVWE